MMRDGIPRTDPPLCAEIGEERGEASSMLHVIDDCRVHCAAFASGEVRLTSQAREKRDQLTAYSRVHDTYTPARPSQRKRREPEVKEDGKRFPSSRKKTSSSF